MPLQSASSGPPTTRLTAAAQALTRSAPDLRTPGAADAVVDLLAVAHRVLVQAAEAVAPRDASGTRA